MNTSPYRPSYAYADATGDGFYPPANKDMPLWRYIDFTKFVSILEDRAIFFSRSDLLGDPFEGSLTKREAEQRPPSTALHRTSPAKVRSEISNTIVSCWHMNPVESMAMWRLYLTGSQGVAIRTSYNHFVASFAQYDGNEKGRFPDDTQKELLVHAGVVHYIDYEGETPQYVPRILFKRKSFEHEREFRAVAKDTSWGNSPRFGNDRQVLTRFAAGGDRVPVDVDKLIQSIYVAPEAPGWFADLVRRIVERYGYNFPVKQSDLSKDPIF